jgi:hypothetical protein
VCLLLFYVSQVVERKRAIGSLSESPSTPLYRERDCGSVGEKIVVGSEARSQANLRGRMTSSSTASAGYGLQAAKLPLVDLPVSTGSPRGAGHRQLHPLAHLPVSCCWRLLQRLRPPHLQESVNHGALHLAGRSALLAQGAAHLTPPSPTASSPDRRQADHSGCVHAAHAAPAGAATVRADLGSSFPVEAAQAAQAGP